MAGSSSSDAQRAARALQGVACVQWFVHQDKSAAEATLRRSIARDPSVRHTWDVLSVVIAKTGEAGMACDDRPSVGESHRFMGREQEFDAISSQGLGYRPSGAQHT